MRINLNNSQNIPPRTRPLKPPYSQGSPKELRPEALHKNLQNFGGVVLKFSLFELSMSFLGSLSTKFDADWVAYFAESFGECLENCLIQDDDKPNPLLDFLKPILRGIAVINNIKSTNGEALRDDNVLEYKEQIIGGINRITSIGSMCNLVVQIYRNFFGSKKNDNQTKLNLFSFVSQFVLPSANALLMWASAIGKKYIANKVQDLDPNFKIDDIRAAMTSGNQDILCGLNSALLMLRQIIEKLSPKLGQFLEPIFAAYISISTLLEGNKASNEDKDSQEKKYQLSTFDQSFVGQFCYKCAKFGAKIFGIEMPEASQLIAI